MLKFTIATLAIVALLLIGALVGGVWIWAGLIYITVFAYAFDRLTPLFFQNADTDAEFPTSDALGVALAFAHFIVLGAVVYTLVHNATLPMLQKIALFCATALFVGQIGHPNAHELIHRPNRLLRRLGKAVYMSILMGHHASAHPLVHHVHVGTSNDPVSAPKGRGFWRFFWARVDRVVPCGLRGRKQTSQGAGPASIHIVPSWCACQFVWRICGRGRHRRAGLGIAWRLCAAANLAQRLCATLWSET